MPRAKKVTGNDNLDKALVQFPKMNNAEALNIGLALQEIMKQNQSILQNQDTMGGELEKLRKRMDKYDTDAEKFNMDREKFMTEVFEKADKLKATGTKKDKLIAKGAKMAQEAIEAARASNASDKIKFEQELARMPKVMVTSTGRLETGIANGQPVTQLVPEEIRIRHKVWRLPIGIPVEVPQAVAERLLDLQKSKAETAELQGVLGAQMEHSKMVSELNKINHKPGYSKTGIAGMEEQL